MRIIEMKATFGKLDGQTLRLEPGMNWIVAPNEWGKSTWCAFLTAMFYGIDTRQRTGKDTLADKERYAPWSGKPMEGMLRLEHQGVDITIFRKTKGRIPLGDFSAIETNTGIPIPELTSENCGQQLLGVERSVFYRCGFIRLSEMPVTQDEALRRRLNALVTTADESDAADQLAARLRELKNRCRYNRSGLIPQTGQRIEALRSELRQRQALDAQLSELLEQEQQAQTMLQELQLHSQWLDYYEGQNLDDQLSRSQKAEQVALYKVKQAKDRCQTHLPRQELLARLSVPEGPQRSGKAGWIWTGLGILALMLAALLAYEKHWDYCAVAAGVGAVLTVIGIGMCRRFYRWKKELRRLAQQRERWNQELSDWDELERWCSEVLRIRQYAKTLRSLTGQASMPEQEDPLELNRLQTDAQLEQTREKLGQYRQLRGECLGKMEGLHQEPVLQEQLHQASQRLKELERTYTALGYAQKALEEAMTQLQRRFAPKITRRAQQLLSQLTLGRYDRLTLTQELKVGALAADEVVQRGTQWRSDGTADQMYLALRIAVWEELMPCGPLILDDVLARFDEQRLNAASAVLKELSQQNQIIVFACR
jgi:uncharacterized protein YhaN